MGRITFVWEPWFLGRDLSQTRWFIAGAIGLYLLTVGLAALGTMLHSQWSQRYAHLVIESGAVLMFVGTIRMAIANAYVNDGILTSILVTFAPLTGLVVYLLIRAAALGDITLAPLTLDTLLSFGAGGGAISLGSYLLGRVLSLQRTPRLQRTEDNL